MTIELQRTKEQNNSVFGELFIDGSFFCYTLEDKERDIKIKAETAIPKGTYKVILNQSSRFKRILPLLIDVPNFEGIRMHPGNTNHDTEGCILVGESRSKDFIGNSKKAFDKLFPKFKGKEITLTIEAYHGA